ncbi:DMT family transporter [Paenibacillus sp. FSL H7-0918]|uniref:DMT family transporter n=1 Tax=Paenibacillus sp. FSL H7-0918 TaxID=2921442 RepID=UPI0030F85297
MKVSRAGTAMLVMILILIWGASFPVYKIALNYAPPLLFTGIRTLAGGAILFLLMVHKRSALRWKANWQIYILSAVLNVILFFGLQIMGLRYLPSGMFAVIVYLQPVMVGVLAWLWLGDQMSALKVTGFLAGFAGVAVASIQNLSGNASAAGLLLALGTAISWSVGTVYVKRVSGRVDFMWLAAMQCLIGGVVLTGAGSITETWSGIVWNGSFLISLLYASVFGVAVSWMLYFFLVNAGNLQKISSFLFLVPIVSVTLGALLLNEPLTGFLLAGLMLIAFSLYCINRQPKVKDP